MTNQEKLMLFLILSTVVNNEEGQLLFTGKWYCSRQLICVRNFWLILINKEPDGLGERDGQREVRFSSGP